MQRVALLGRRIDYSLSPAMQTAAFRHLGLDVLYVPLQVEPEDCPAAVQALRRLDFLGANVTIPYKEQVALLVDELAPAARDAGSVNTILSSRGRLTGFSTDGEGFINGCRAHGVETAGRKVLLLGAGGAARAVARAVAASGAASLLIANRAAAKAEALARMVAAAYPRLAVQALAREELSASNFGGFDLMVNATPLGMLPTDPLPCPASVFRPGQTLIELLYAPPETRLMGLARASGARAFNGLAMLLYQGAASCAIWTGRPAPVAVMAETLARAAGVAPDSIPLLPPD